MFDHEKARQTVDRASRQHDGGYIPYEFEAPLISAADEALNEILRLQSELDCAITALSARSGDDLRSTINQQVAEAAKEGLQGFMAEAIARIEEENARLKAENSSLQAVIDDWSEFVGTDDDEDIPPLIDPDTLHEHLQKAADMVMDATDAHVRITAINRLSWIGGWVAGQQEERG